MSIHILYTHIYLSTAICISMYVTCGPLYDNPIGSVYLRTKNRKELTYNISSTLKLAAKCPPSLYTIYVCAIKTQDADPSVLY